MMSENLRPIDAAGHVPAPHGQPPNAITADVTGEFEALARCHECSLVTLHAWDCVTGSAINDMATLLAAAEVIDRRWPGGTGLNNPRIAGDIRLRAEWLARSIS